MAHNPRVRADTRDPMPGHLLLIEAILGVGVLVALATLAWLGVASFRRSFGVPATVGLLVVTAALWAVSGLLPFPHGNELVNWQSSLVAVLTGYDLVGYPHPSL